MSHRHPIRAQTLFQQPMVSADFGYSPLGSLAAIALALAIAALLYAFTVWPLETAGWLATAAALRLAGRHPIGSLLR